MAVRISMEDTVTLTKSVKAKLVSYNTDTKSLKVELDGKMTVVFKVIEGSDDEVLAMVGQEKTLDPNGLFSDKVTETKGVSPTRSGCAAYREID